MSRKAEARAQCSRHDHYHALDWKSGRGAPGCLVQGAQCQGPSGRSWVQALQDPSWRRADTVLVLVVKIIGLEVQMVSSRIPRAIRLNISRLGLIPFHLATPTNLAQHAIFDRSEVKLGLFRDWSLETACSCPREKVRARPRLDWGTKLAVDHRVGEAQFWHDRVPLDFSWHHRTLVAVWPHDSFGVVFSTAPPSPKRSV